MPGWAMAMRARCTALRSCQSTPGSDARFHSCSGRRRIDEDDEDDDEEDDDEDDDDEDDDDNGSSSSSSKN